MTGFLLCFLLLVDYFSHFVVRTQHFTVCSSILLSYQLQLYPILNTPRSYIAYDITTKDESAYRQHQKHHSCNHLYLVFTFSYKLA